MEKIVPYLIIGAVALLILIILIKNICIVQQSRAYVIERLGAFSQVWEVGIHFKLPFVERIARRVSLKEQVLDYPPQPVITKDNVTMQIDTVVYFQITDPKLYTYGVEQPMVAMETLTATTLRNIIGDLELDQTLTSRDVINTKMRAILDEATDPWGIKVTRVELKNILPPQDIQNSMEKQMKAERDRRQAILQAEGNGGGHADAERRLPERSGHQAQGARGHAEGRRRQGHEDHHPLGAAGPCRPCGRTGRNRPRAEAVSKMKWPALKRVGHFCRKKTTGPAGGYDWKGRALCPEDPACCGAFCSLRWQFISSAPLLPCRS